MRIKTKLLCFVETYPGIDIIKRIYLPWSNIYAIEIKDGQEKKYNPRENG